jgi:WD40 repeat protein
MATPDNRLALIAPSVLDEEENLTGESRLLIIDLETGEILSEPALAELNGNNFIESISINPAGDQAFAIITDLDDEFAGSTGVILSLPAGEFVAAIPFDTDVSYSRYSPNGSKIAVAIPDPSQRYFTVLDAVTGEQLAQLGSRSNGHAGGVGNQAFVFTPDGKRLVSASNRGDVLLWDTETGEIIQRLIGHGGGEAIFSVAVSPDGQTAISSGSGGVGSLRFWDISEGAAAQVFDEHVAGLVFDVAISPDGSKAISTTISDPDETGNEAILWDTNTFEVIHRLPGTFLSAKFLPDGRSAILGGNAAGNDQDDPEMLLVHWDLESGTELNRIESTEISEVFDIALSPDNRSLLLSARGLMKRFDIETFTEMKSFAADNDDEWLVSVAFNPDGQTAIAGGDLGELILYDLDTGEEIRRYNQGGASWGLDISADGERFVSGGSNSTAVLWDIASGEPIQTFNGHTNNVDGVAFTPDESQIVSGSADGTLILWDVATGEALRTFSEHGGVWVNKVALSPDGLLAYSASDDGTVIVRPIAEMPVDEILAHVADNRVLRDFTCVERKQYRVLPLCDANGVVPESGD